MRDLRIEKLVISVFYPLTLLPVLTQIRLFCSPFPQTYLSESLVIV